MNVLLLSSLDVILAGAAVAVASLIGAHHGRVTCPACERRRRLDRQLARAEADRRELEDAQFEVGFDGAVRTGGVVVQLPTLAEQLKRELQRQARAHPSMPTRPPRSTRQTW